MADNLIRVRTGETQGERQAVRLVASQSHDHHLIRMRNEYLPREACGTDPVADAGNGLRQVQLAAVVLRFGVAVEPQLQIADRLIGRLAGGNAEHGGVAELSGFIEFLFCDQLADFRQVLEGAWTVVIVRRSGPERVFVERDAFLGDTAKHHRAEPAVAQWHGFQPGPGRLTIPERRDWILRRRGPAGELSGVGPIAEPQPVRGVAVTVAGILAGEPPVGRGPCQSVRLVGRIGCQGSDLGCAQGAMVDGHAGDIAPETVPAAAVRPDSQRLRRDAQFPHPGPRLRGHLLAIHVELVDAFTSAERTHDMRQAIGRQLAVACNDPRGRAHSQRDAGSGVQRVCARLLDDSIAALIDHLGSNPRLQGDGIFAIQEFAAVGNPPPRPVQAKRFVRCRMQDSIAQQGQRQYRDAERGFHRSLPPAEREGEFHRRRVSTTKRTVPNCQ